jgi:hypothetical protein
MSALSAMTVHLRQSDTWDGFASAALAALINRGTGRLQKPANFKGTAREAAQYADAMVMEKYREAEEEDK